jgi:hypothetical protein
MRIRIDHHHLDLLSQGRIGRLSATNEVERLDPSDRPHLSGGWRVRRPAPQFGVAPQQRSG